MSEKCDIKIVAMANSGPKIGGTRVWVNDQEVIGIRKVSLNHGADDVAVLTLDLIPTAVRVEGTARVETTDGQHLGVGVVDMQDKGEVD